MIKRNFTWSGKIAIDKYNKLEMELENESPRSFTWRVKIVEKNCGELSYNVDIYSFEFCSTQ